jgi:hypothetical protein
VRTTDLCRRHREHRRLATALSAGIAVLAAARSASAVTCSWAKATNSNWNTSGNWSCGHVPANGDDVVFGTVDANDGNCSIDVAPNNLNSFQILSTYSGTISQSAARTITSGSFSQAGGTLNQLADLDISGNFTMTGGTFNAPLLLYVGGVFSKSGGTFNGGTGSELVALTSTANQSHTVTNTSFRNLAITGRLIGYWPLDEAAASTTAVDYSGWSNDMTRSTGKTAPAGASTLFNNPYGTTFAKAAPYHLGSAPTPFVTATNWTMSAWVKITDVGGASGANSCGDGTSNLGAEVINVNNDYALRLCAANSNSGTATYVRSWLRYGASSYDGCVSSNTFAMDNTSWHHVAATYNGTTMYVYLDGTITSCTLSRTQTFSTATDVAIGGHINLASYELGGSIDDVRIYNNDFAEGLVLNLYAGGVLSAMPGTTTLSVSSGNVDVNGNFIIANNNVASSADVTVGGSWWNFGGRWIGTGTVTLDGTGGGSIVSNNNRFAALTVGGTGTWTLKERLWVDDVLSITSGTLASGNYNIHAATFSKSDGAGAGFTPGTGTVVLDSSTPRIVTNDSAFYNIRYEDPTESNLLAYWKFDEFTGVTVKDMSGNGRDLTFPTTVHWQNVAQGATYTPSRVTFDNPASVEFDGSGDYGTFTAPAHATSLTISAWVKRTADGDSSPRVVTLPTGRLYIVTNTAGTNDKIGFYQDCDGTDGQWETTTTMNRTGWHHIAVTYSYANTSQDPLLYIDGASQAKTKTVTPTSVTCTNTGTGYVGAQSTTNNNLAADIDDVRIYNTILSAAQITALYNGGHAGTGGTTTFTLQSNTTVSGTSAIDSGATQTVYRAREDMAGVPEGYPAVSFDWSNYNYHATYVVYNPTGGPGRIYKRDTNGAASGYFELASGRTFVGGAKWTHDGVAASAVYYIYAIDDQGRVYKLNDASFTASGGSAVLTYRDATGGANATASSGVAIDTTNIYWTGKSGDGSTNKIFRLLMSNMTTVSSQSATAVQGAIPTIATVSSTDYMFYANATKLYKAAVSPSLGAPSASTLVPTAGVYGRVTIPSTIGYFVDYAGKVQAFNPSTLASTWTYQDTDMTRHGGSCSSGTSCAAKNIFVNWGSLTANGNVIFGDKDGHVYSLNAATGAILSTGYPHTPSGSNVFESAPLYRGGVIAIGNTTGTVFLIDHRTLSTGTPAAISSYDFCTTATCANSAVSSISYDFDGGQYVVATADGKLFYITAVSDPTNTYN